jgi:hypothetical protein
MSANKEKSHARHLSQKSTSISLPVDLWKKATEEAQRMEMKFSSLVRLAVKEKLARLAALEYPTPVSTIATVNEPPSSLSTAPAGARVARPTEKHCPKDDGKKSQQASWSGFRFFLERNGGIRE